MGGNLQGLWPEIVDARTARAAAKHGAQAAFIVAGVTAVISGIAVFNGPLLGIDGWSLFDAAFVAVVGWRILRMSRPWAIVGLLYWLATLGAKLAAGTVRSPTGVIALFVLMYFISGVRGTFAYRRYQSPQPAAVVAA